MLQTDYVIGSPLNHQDPFIQRHGSQLTANEPPPFRQPFTSGLFFPGTSTGEEFEFRFENFEWKTSSFELKYSSILLKYLSIKLKSSSFELKSSSLE